MALQRLTQSFNFSQGMETKTDPFQIPFGKFLLLKNIIFTTTAQASKRNGYAQITALPSSDYDTVSTFNGDLVAIKDRIQSYSANYQGWTDKGPIQPIGLGVISLVRSNTNQSQIDSCLSSNGLLCTVYTDQNTSNLSQKAFKYIISDQFSGTNILPAHVIPGDVTYGMPRVFFLGNYFIILYTSLVSAVYHLNYIAISCVTPLATPITGTISTSVTPSTGMNFDAVVYNNVLFVAWNGAASSGVKMTFLTANLGISVTLKKDKLHTASLLSVSLDSINGIIWVSYFNSSLTKTFSFAVDHNLNTILSPTETSSGTVFSNITSSAQAGVNTLFYEVPNNYGYDSSIASNIIKTQTVTQTGTVGAVTTLIRSVGLASQSFILNGLIYFLCAYESPYQSTYFLSNSQGQLIAKLAYSNGNGYLPTGLPSVNVSGTDALIPYLLKTSIQAVNKNTNVTSHTQVAGIYSQVGINLARFSFGSFKISTVETGNNLLIPGGFLWSYDGNSAVEQGFHLWPDSVEASWSASGGSVAAQPDGSTNTNAYFIQVTYEWSDDQGNLFRSAPSIPVAVTTTGSGTSGSISISVPTLRLTYKTSNPVKIVVYRWSAAQQIYYQSTSIQTPVLNDLSVDYVTYTDTHSDATILGNNILYTNGGVVENIGGPACTALALFDNRLLLINAENQNLIGFSKQVLQSTPVELSDLLTISISPNLGPQGSSGKVESFAPMDDKIILFKENSILYVNGSGPDNTGANNQYSQPIYITSVVGCKNQNSIAFTPKGLMFQSPSKGIWLLGRDLSTRYIGSAVEAYNNLTVLSAESLPETNFVLFTLSNGVTLMYDYFVDQWGTFEGNPSISATLYQNLHTTINSSGQVFQETPGQYLDGSNPISMGFKTGWISLAGLQGYQRGYYFFLLGKYLSPHFLSVKIAYDFSEVPSQGFLVYPPNFTGPYGSDPTYGDSLFYGGSSSLEQFRFFLSDQKCQSFQISIDELYDPTFGTTAGAGVSFSGINIVYGAKKGYPKLGASQSYG